MRLSRPTLGPEELSGVADVLDSGYLTQGSRAADFERRVADYVGADFGFATSSCTTALHLVLSALDIGPGDEVIVSDFTFPASANAVVRVGATPVLVDIDLESLTSGPREIAGAVKERTKAIMPVHAFGQCSDISAIRSAVGADLPIIEDAATALGSKINGTNAGALGDVACFSFHPRKIITTGEGGVVTTSDPALAERIALLRSHGARSGELYPSFEEAGFNYRLSDVNAAIGLVQLDRLESIISHRRALAEQYRAALTEVQEVNLIWEQPGSTHTFQSLVCLLDQRINRDEVIRGMADAAIESTLGTYALHCQPYFARLGWSCGDLPNSAVAFRQSLTLPLTPDMQEEDVSTVVDCLREVVAQQMIGVGQP